MQGELDFDEFIAREGLDAARYVDEWTRAGRPRLDEAFFDRALGVLESLDEYHLVLVIQLGSECVPQRLAERLPRLLVHEHQSVRAAASRAIQHLSSIDPAFFEEVRHFADSAPEELVDLAELATRVRKGKAP